MESLPDTGPCADCGLSAPLGLSSYWPLALFTVCQQKEVEMVERRMNVNPVSTNCVVTGHVHTSVQDRTSIGHGLLKHYIKQHLFCFPLTLVHCICLGPRISREENYRDIFLI